LDQFKAEDFKEIWVRKVEVFDKALVFIGKDLGFHAKQTGRCLDASIFIAQGRAYGEGHRSGYFLGTFCPVLHADPVDLLGLIMEAIVLVFVMNKEQHERAYHNAERQPSYIDERIAFVARHIAQSHDEVILEHNWPPGRSIRHRLVPAFLLIFVAQHRCCPQA